MPPGSGDVTVSGRHVHDMSWPLHEVGALLESRFIHPRRRWVPQPAQGPGARRLDGLRLQPPHGRDGPHRRWGHHHQRRPAGSIPAGSARRRCRPRLRSSAATSTHLPWSLRATEGP